MSKPVGRTCALIVAALVAASCSRGNEEARPVATPSVTLSRADVGVGTPVEITYRFAVAPDAPALAQDYIVFVHFLDVDREQMWDDDHEPATPTTQWKPGATIEYTRTVFVPKFPYVGETAIELGLYSPESGERLPLAGDDSGMRAYRVATFTMSLKSDNLFVIFTDGWHETEVSDDGRQQWQWSTKEGTLSFRNPKSDAIVLVELDQPVRPFDTPQRVEVKVGGAVVDGFELPFGARTLRRLSLTAAQLGAGENVDMAISVDRTFIPSAIPALSSNDPRELGVRVFRAYVEARPK